MKLTKKIILGLAAVSLTGAVFAQEFGNWDSDFGDSGSDSASSALTVGGSVEANGRVYVDKWDDEDNKYPVEDLKTQALVSGKLNLNYAGANTDLSMTLKLDKTSLLDGYYWDILDEFTARAYCGNLQLEAGKMRVVWGKGDKLHVLDNFNANDYLDYIIPDYIDRRISEPMFRAVYNTPGNVRFEAIYTPVMTADRLADSGVWQPKASKKLTENVTELQLKRLNEALAANNGAAVAEISSFSADNLYPDTFQLKYGQAGIRSTFTVGPVDLGVSYYYGHNKQPSANVKKMFEAGAAAKMKQDANSSSITALDTVFDSYKADLPELDYDSVQVFGLEAAGILFGRFNSRAEFAYNLTKDTDGSDPWVHNNSLAWVAGFDIDLPVHNINLNIQENGKYILNYDKIEENEFKPLEGTPYAGIFKASYKEYDVDYTSKDTPWNNKLVVDITDSWNHEKIKLDLKGIWGIERGDLIVMPTLTFTVKDDFKINASGMYIWCKDSDSEFDGWEHNSFAQIGAKYQF